MGTLHVVVIMLEYKWRIFFLSSRENKVDILVDDIDGVQHCDADTDYAADGDYGDQCSKTGHSRCLSREEYRALSLLKLFRPVSADFHCQGNKKRLVMRMTLLLLLFLLKIIQSEVMLMRMKLMLLRRHYTLCVYYSRLPDWCRMGLFLTHESHDNSAM